MTVFVDLGVVETGPVRLCCAIGLHIKGFRHVVYVMYYTASAALPTGRGGK